MALKVSDIFQQKLNEIQNRIPVKMNTAKAEIPFQAALDNASSVLPDNSGTNAIDKEGNDRSYDVQRALSARASSNAAIPQEKSKLMDIINQNVDASARKYGIDPDLIRAVITQESGFNPNSLSHTGAQGLMQLMPGTADALGVNDPWDIAQNIDGGTKYIRDQLQTFNGDIRLALAAYNAGPYAVKKYNGIPPYAETQDYVTKVINYYRQYVNQK